MCLAVKKRKDFKSQNRVIDFRFEIDLVSLRQEGRKKTMANGCINGSLDGANYSSPVPVIGLYIAAASSLCMLMMLYDIIVAGVLARKRWLPCKWFTLNSVTLTLLSVAAKLPVDLTTPMPSPQDQLSKLTGTVLICISMGFLLPSLGVNSDSECFTNMVALSIFVVTVAVNICIQLYTGVIILFFVEHIIILIMMLLLLFTLWHASSHLGSHKRTTSDIYHNLFSKGQKCMFDRLRLCYLYAYCSNPQFEISMHPMSAAVSTICVLCFVILTQAIFRSLILGKLHFCQGISDYGWSMPFIVATQTVTILIGTMAITFRWLTLFPRMELETVLISFQGEDDHVRQRNKTLRKGIWTTLRRLWMSFVSLNMRIILIAQVLIVSPSVLVRYFLRVYKPDNLEYFNALKPEEIITAGWYITRKSVDDMIKLRDEVCKGESLKPLLHLLSENGPSELLHEIQGQVNCVTIALLVKIAEVSIPKERLVSLLHAYEEANEIILFIDKTLQLQTSENEVELSYAKEVWKGGDFTCLLPSDITGIQSGLDRSLAAIKKLKEILHSGNIWSQLGFIIDLINLNSHSSIESLYRRMEQLFVDMLHASLSQLPLAIYRKVTVCPAEEFEDIVQLAMKFLLKTGSLKHIHWSCPPGSSIPSFVQDIEAHGHASEEFTGPLTGLEKIVPVCLDLDLLDQK